jgi:hypothetical protein
LLGPSFPTRRSSDLAVAFESVGSRIRVRLTMKATRPSRRDVELAFDVAPRNIGGGG